MIGLVLDYYLGLGVIKVCLRETKGRLKISCLLSGQIISTHGGNYQEERKSMIELVLAYYLVLGVIKLCLWGKRGVKIYLVWPSYFYFPCHGFQYFSSLPVLHYLQVLLFLRLKLEQFSWMFSTTLFKIRRYQRPLFEGGGGKSTWYHPVLKGLSFPSSSSLFTDERSTQRTQHYYPAHA